MFYIFYKFNIFIKKTENDEINDFEKNALDHNKVCALCLENNNSLFYNYNYKKNKFIHNCLCRPNIHYECFKINYNKQKSCIICLKEIYRKDDLCDNIFFLRCNKFKLAIFWTIMLIIIYSFFFNNEIVFFIDDVV